MHCHFILMIVFLFTFNAVINGIDLLKGKPKSPILREQVVPEPDVTKVSVIFMNHLDVGYSDNAVKLVGWSANVLNTYFHVHFPAAIKLAQTMRAGGFVEPFVYTTHPWLLYFYLKCPVGLTLANIPVKCPTAVENANMLAAIKRGDILWHDGPMNMNFENMNAFGLAVSLNISANLNRMVGITKPNRVVSIRDVPGVSRGVIRTLRKYNFVGITSGVNSGSAPPSVPPLSLWRAAKQTPNEVNVPEIVYMQDPFGYPDPPGPSPNNPGGFAVNRCFRAPGTTEVMCFMFRSDNMGPPQSIQEVLSCYEILRARYVKAVLTSGSLDAFFTLLWKNRNKLPVVDAEMGDTWIQGTASDPKKFARFRAMQREFQFYYQLGFPITAEVVDASRFMIKPAEHTYGLPGVADNINWKNVDFEKVRGGLTYTQSELAWTEQRQYEQMVLNILGPNHLLTRAIQKAYKDLEDFSGRNNKYTELLKVTVPDQTYNFTCSNASHHINVSFKNGAIVHLDANGVVVSETNPLGRLRYRTYNETDTNFWLSYYKTTWNTGYGKPNSTINAHPESREWPMSMRTIYRDMERPCGFLAVLSPANSTASTYYGMPSSVIMMWDIDFELGEVSTEMYWDDKTPTRLMESLFLEFSPRATVKGAQWYFSKVGDLISPNSVMFNGSQWQHNVDDGGVQLTTAAGAKPLYRTIAWDTGIVCPITAKYGPTAWPAPLVTIHDQLTGVAFNIFNNIWNTNYIFWYPYRGVGTENDNKFKARFSTSLQLVPHLNH